MSYLQYQNDQQVIPVSIVLNKITNNQGISEDIGKSIGGRISDIQSPSPYLLLSKSS